MNAPEKKLRICVLPGVYVLRAAPAKTRASSRHAALVLLIAMRRVKRGRAVLGRAAPISRTFALHDIAAERIVLDSSVAVEWLLPGGGPSQRYAEGIIERISAGELFPAVPDPLYSPHTTPCGRWCQTRSYRINPIGLVVRDGVIYLVASLAENDALRQFVLHRIKSAQVLDETATSPRGFDLDKYIEEGGFGWPTGRKIRLVAIFDRGPADTLAETQLSPDQTIRKLDEDGFELTATVQETKELYWWLSSFGPEVEVVEPKSLRALMRNLVRSSAKRYRN